MSFITIPGTQWTFDYREEQIQVVEAGTLKLAVDLINKWAQVFPHEGTWVRRECGVPSLIIRLDFAPAQGKLGLFEVEERPAGVGLNTYLNPDFSNRLEVISRTWPHFVVVMSDHRQKGGDDSLWREVASLDLVHGRHVLVRAEPEEDEFHSLLAQSVSSVLHKGNKSYGEALGLWRRVRDPDDFPSDGGFALKPIQGSKCRGVYVLPPRGVKLEGGATLTKATRELGERGEMYMQEWIPPLNMDINGRSYNAIWRLFFGYDIQNKTWIPLGGAWVARPGTLRIHGALDMVTGPLVIEGG